MFENWTGSKIHFRNIINILFTALIFSTSSSLLAGCGGSGGESSSNVTPSSNKDIAAFSFTQSSNSSLPADTTGSISGNDISVVLPYGVSRTSLIATFSTTGATVKIGGITQTCSVTTNNFTNPVTYSVTAEDGSTKNYTVTVTNAANTAKDLTAFSVLGVSGTISGTSISVTVPNGTDLSAMVATFSTTGQTVKVGSTVQISGNTVNNFTVPVTYTVTAGDTSTKNYTVTVTAAAAITGSYIADYTVAKDSILRAIPDTYINTARTTLHVAYNHTSHGTHVSYGIYGLPGFKTGDSTKFGITRNSSADPNKLDFKDNQIGGAYSDLSQADANWTTWMNQVRSYLDNSANAAINVMMWSWCDIAGHSVSNYLSSMQTLINEYGQSGTKIGTGAGKTRTTPVTFIFMTGHANGNANTGAGNPRDQAKLITDYCTAHGYYCIDYYSIDSHAMSDTYYEDVNDDAYSTLYGGNFYLNWQNSTTLGTDWYQNRTSPGGSIEVGNHNTQHITANRKAFAFWWVLARIAGYSGQ